MSNLKYIFRTTGLKNALLIFSSAIAFSLSVNAFEGMRSAMDHYKVNEKLTGYSTDLFGDTVSTFDGSVTFRQVDISIPGNSELKVEIARLRKTKEDLSSFQGHFMDWQLDVPVIYWRRNATMKNPLANFSSFSPVTGGWVDSGIWPPPIYNRLIRFDPTDNLCSNPTEYGPDYGITQGPYIRVNGEEQLLYRLHNNATTGYPAEVKYKTKNHWIFTCTDSTSSDLEGFVATSPKGVKYTFDNHQAYDLEKNMNPSAVASAFLHVMRASKVEDRQGNSVTYNYQGHRLESISASDGRFIDIEYDDLGETRKDSVNNDLSFERTEFIKTISYNGKTYTYEYNDLNLHKVIRPDLKFYEFTIPEELTLNYDIYIFDANTQTLPENYPFVLNTVIDITHPEGATARFDFTGKDYCMSRFIIPTLNIDWGCYANPETQSEFLDNYYSELLFLNNKTINYGGDTSYQWSYSILSGEDENKAGVAYSPERVIKVQSPDAITEYTYSQERDETSGQLRQIVVKDLDGSVKRTTTYGYEKHLILENLKCEYNGCFDTEYERNDLIRTERVLFAEVSRYKFLRNSSVIVEGDSTYTKDVLDFDTWDQPYVIHEHNSFSNHEKYTRNSYKHDTTNWGLNYPEKVELSTDNETWTVVSETKYHAASAAAGYRLQPKESLNYGVWQQKYSEYFADGMIKKIELNGKLQDGTTNRYITYGNYHRGKARTTSLPPRLTGTDVSSTAEVNDDGWITQSNDFNGNITNYGYDNVGRLTYIDPVDTSVADTFISWDWGNPATKKLIVKTGKRCTLNDNQTGCKANTELSEQRSTYDYLLREVLLENVDSTTIVKINRDYDSRNNELFTSFPWHSTGPDGSDIGTNRGFDSLNRLTSLSVNDGGQSSYNYLDGNKIRVIDAENNTTTTTYLAFGQPSYEQATKIEAPENVTTDIGVDIFGSVNTIRQHNLVDTPNVDETEYRAYDTQKRLCQIKRDDVGTEVYKLNVLGELEWYAQGQAATSNNSCNTTADSDEKISYTYNNHGDIRTITYGDENTAAPLPTRTFTYDDNGNVKTISSSDFTQSFNYNSENRLEDETLAIDGRNFVLDYQYNALGHLDSLTYPDDTPAVNFAPNSFGYATQAIRTYSDSTTDVFVRGGTEKATYHPNGLADTFVYGNGIKHKTRLNSRLAPECIQDYRGNVLPDCDNASAILNLSYTFDNNYNITSILNPRDAGIYSLTSLVYDDLDRLIETHDAFNDAQSEGDSGIGDSVITYDGLGNIRSYSNDSLFNEHNLTYSYTNNRLTGVTGAGASGYNFSGNDSYDSRGNITHNGKHNFVYNLANHMVQSGDNSYLYDGYNRRIKTTKSDGTVEYSIYGQSGVLYYREIDDEGINYIFLGDKLIAREGTGVQPHQDSIVNYKPFGQSIEPPKDEVAYTGHKFDTDIGLSYMQARYYDPVIGRFYSNDPIAYTDENPVMSFNRYLYVNNNPYKYTDPDGEFFDIILDIGFIAYDLYDMATNGVNETNTASLVANVGGFLLPGVTGLGTGVRVGEKGVDAMKTVRKTCCFVAGTQVLTKDGYKNIEDVQLGEKLWAKNTDTGEQDWKPVTKVFIEPDRGIYEIRLVADDGFVQKIQATDDHPFFVLNKGWRQTVELEIGDLIETDGNGAMKVISVVDEQRLDLTYNFTITDFHTYYVTRKNVLVHNCNITLMDPKKIELSHPVEMSRPFSDPKNGTVADLAKKLRDDPNYADSIPPIEVAKIKGKIYSANNRRLRAFQAAGVPIKTVPASKEQLRAIKNRLAKKKK